MADDRDRAYTVSGEDEHGDIHLFATDDRSRAESALLTYRDTLKDVEASWVGGASS